MRLVEEAHPQQLPCGRRPGEQTAEAAAVLPSIDISRRALASTLVREQGSASPRYVLCAEETLPSLSGHRRRPEKLAVALCVQGAADGQHKVPLLHASSGPTKFAAQNSGDSGRAALSLLVAPKKSPCKEAVLRQATAAQRPSSAAGPVRYCTSDCTADVRIGGTTASASKSWIRASAGPTAEHAGGAAAAASTLLRMGEAVHAQLSRSRPTLLVDAGHAADSGSVPSTPRQPSRSASREPSVRVRRAWLREAAGCLGGLAANRPPPPHLPVPPASPAASGGHLDSTSAEARQRSAGDSRRQSHAPWQGHHASHRPLSSSSHASTPPRRRTAGDVAGAGTPQLLSPRVFGDVSDALKERCTSALSSTLRDMPELKDEHKSQIMDSYCHEVCVALQDHDGLRRENIMASHRQEKEALRRALLTERERQAQILERKLAQRRRDKEAAAAGAAAAAAVAAAADGGEEGAGKSRAEEEQKEADARCMGHRCGCAGDRNADGECVDCSALRFCVKNSDVRGVLRAVSMLLVRQAALFPSLRDRIEPGCLVVGAGAGSGRLGGHRGGGGSEAGRRGDAEGGSGGRRDEKGEGEGTEGKSQRECAAVCGQRQRPATACGGRASDMGLPEGSLPEGWLIRTSRSSGKSFYYHPASKTTQWQHP
jgi:hypothetical protein